MEIELSNNNVDTLINELMLKVKEKDEDSIWSILHRITEIVYKQQEELKKYKNEN